MQHLNLIGSWRIMPKDETARCFLNGIPTGISLVDCQQANVIAASLLKVGM